VPFFSRIATLPVQRQARWKRLLRWIALLGAGLFVLSVLVVFVLRFVPVPTTAFMLERKLDAALEGPEGFRMAYEWIPLERMSAQLPIAVVAAEDQKFPHHHGFDVEAI
jgi:monofunctional biosynthetic peptidoglycan transglycosylase